MTKIFYDSDDLKNRFSEEVSSLIVELESAKNAADSFDVPSYYWDYFEYKSYLKSLSSDIKGIIEKCEKINNWIDSSIKSYMLFSEGAIDLFNSIDNLDIKERTSIVRRY